MSENNPLKTINVRNIVTKLITENTFTGALVVALCVMSFMLGSLSQQVTYLSGNSGGTAKTGGSLDAPTPTRVNNQENAKPDLDKPGDKDHILGNKNAKVALIEYSDYSCPFCKRFHDAANQLIKEYGDNVMWVYRHFPLQSIHPLAQKQSEASECAAKLGGNAKFWEFSDKLYAAENAPDEAEMLKIASSLGLNSNAFKSCVDSGEMADKVDGDFASGIKASVQGTPGNFLMNLETGEVLNLQGAGETAESMKTKVQSMIK
jgi:protein-disulfide isomerase